jgi:hypothetical protein
MHVAFSFLLAAAAVAAVAAVAAADALHTP